MNDVVASRSDAGVRLSDQVAEGMIAMQIVPDMRMAIVATFSCTSQNVRRWRYRTS
jgi:hypothetical protein